MSVLPTLCVFQVEPHRNHFSSLLFSHQTEGNTSVQLQQFNSSIVLTWLLWNYLCWESATWLPVSLNRCPNKLWEVKPGDGQSPAGSPRILLVLWCSEFRTFLSSRSAELRSTSGLRGKDGGWKGNYFLLQLSVLMTQIGEVCKLKEMPGWIWNWDLLRATFFSGSYISLKCSFPSYERNFL